MENLLLGLGANSARTFNGLKSDIVQLIEVSGPGTAKRTTVTEDLIHEYIARDFSSTTTKLHTEKLKFFFSLRQGDYNGEMIPIPMSQLLYEKIAPYARIPSIYPDVLYRKTAMTVYTTPQLPPNASPLSPASIQHEYLSFILQSIPGATAGICASTSFTYHFPTRHMYSFMHCLADNNCKLFRTSIEHSSLIQQTPFLVPSVLIQFNLERRLKSLNEAHDDIYRLELVLGIRYGHPAELDVGKLDFGPISKGLNAVTADLAFMTWSCKNTTRQLAFLDDVAGKYAELAVQNELEEDQAYKTKGLLLETHAHLRCWNEGMDERAEYLSKRAQALVQTVYSGVAQRDAALSQNAAIASAEDSAVVRVIAAITIIFLPATTTATLFGTTFFDFNVGRHERVHSRWLWLYWVVTIPLTAIVLVGAVFWWRRKQTEVASRVGKIKGAGSGERRRFEKMVWSDLGQDIRSGE